MIMCYSYHVIVTFVEKLSFATQLRIGTHRTTWDYTDQLEPKVTFGSAHVVLLNHCTICGRNFRKKIDLNVHKLLYLLRKKLPNES